MFFSTFWRTTWATRSETRETRELATARRCSWNLCRNRMLLSQLMFQWRQLCLIVQMLVQCTSARCKKRGLYLILIMDARYNYCHCSCYHLSTKLSQELLRNLLFPFVFHYQVICCLWRSSEGPIALFKKTFYWSLWQIWEEKWIQGNAFSVNATTDTWWSSRFCWIFADFNV